MISTYKIIYGFPAPILLAILLNEVRNRYFKRAVQSITYLPFFLSWVVLSGIFIITLSPTVGPVNNFISMFGFDRIFFMGSNKWFRTVLVITSIWKYAGWQSIIYIASLSSIDIQLYEAATIDGANRFQKINI